MVAQEPELEHQPRPTFHWSSTNQSMAIESEGLKLCQGYRPLCPWQPKMEEMKEVVS